MKALGELASWTASPASATPLNGTLGPHRTFDWLTMPLGDVLAVSAYVGTMRGTAPANAKAPQGDVFEYDRDAILAAEAEEIAAEEGEQTEEAGAPEGEGEPATEG